MKLKYVPFVGLVSTFIAHWRATSRHHKDPFAPGAYDATWEAFDDYHVALACTFAPVVAICIIFAAVSAFTR